MGYCVEYYLKNEYMKKNFKNDVDMDAWIKKMKQTPRYTLHEITLVSRDEMECINCGCIDIIIAYERGDSDWFEMPFERIEYCEQCGLMRNINPSVRRFYAYLKQRGYEWDKDWHGGCWVNRVNYIRYFILYANYENGFLQREKMNGFTYMIQGERDTIQVSAKNTDFTSLCQLVIDLEEEIKKKRL